MADTLKDTTTDGQTVGGTMPATVDLPTLWGDTIWGDTLRCFRKDRWVTAQLLRTGEFSPGEADLFRLIAQHLQPGAVAIEVGANIGAHTATLSRCFNEVYALEPCWEIYHVLKHNKEFNRWNVSIHPIGLSDRAGYFPLAFDPANPGGTQINLDPDSPARQGYVEVITLDAWRTSGDVHFLKIDVEGHEAHVLRGAEESILGCCPVLYFEIDRSLNPDGTPGPAIEALDLAESYGYDLWFHAPPLARDKADCTEAGVVYASHNALGIPKGRYESLRAALGGVPDLYPMVREVRPEVKAWKVDNAKVEN